jgi:hypothetical protein
MEIYESNTIKLLWDSLPSGESSGIVYVPYGSKISSVP